MEIRSAKEIESTTKFSASVVLPSIREKNIIARCNELGYRYIGFMGEWKGASTRVLFTCDRGHDYDASIHKFLNGKTTCSKCAFGEKKKQREQDKVLRRITECLGDYKFIGFDGDWNGSKGGRIIVQCPNGHAPYSVLYENFVFHSRRCPRCMNKGNLSEHDALQYIKECIGDYEFLGFVGKWTTSIKTRMKVKCPNGHEYTASYNNFVNNGRRCACCMKCGYNPSHAGYLYVQHVTGEVNAIKFGITNREPTVRMKQHDFHSKLNHELVFAWKFDNGQMALDVENYIKRKWRDKTRHVPKELMKDGFTETLPEEMMKEFLKDVKSLCNLAKMNISLA
ncbi:hypothetical protein OGT82_001184 [Salmonella enterica]|nr:hypothetical protein [Salmonella enterica]